MKDKKFTYHQEKDSKLLMTASYWIFITKKWVKVHVQSGSAQSRYKQSKQIRWKSSMLRSNLYDFSDVYIVVKGNISLTEAVDRTCNEVRNRFLVFKNNAPFTNCISKINNWQCRRFRYCNAHVQFARVQ